LCPSASGSSGKPVWKSSSTSTPIIGNAGCGFAVNISSLQFIRDGFLDDVRQILEETGLPPQLLKFEVTESVLLDGAEPIVELMETLKTMGIRVALDDFGTGFSSLSYLRDLPTHMVKLDRSFVQEVATDRRIAAIVEGVITMAHHMDMIVVAEGIETRAQQDDLARRHCDILQGYLFARPMPLAELKNLPDFYRWIPRHDETAYPMGVIVTGLVHYTAISACTVGTHSDRVGPIKEKNSGQENTDWNDRPGHTGACPVPDHCLGTFD